MDNKLYDVFIRTWYRYGTRSQFTGKRAIVPGPGRKTYLARAVSQTAALDICQRYNATHKPGPLSRKAEYISI